MVRRVRERVDGVYIHCYVYWSDCSNTVRSTYEVMRWVPRWGEAGVCKCVDGGACAGAGERGMCVSRRLHPLVCVLAVLQTCEVGTSELFFAHVCCAPSSRRFFCAEKDTRHTWLRGDTPLPQRSARLQVRGCHSHLSNQFKLMPHTMAHKQHPANTQPTQNIVPGELQATARKDMPATSKVCCLFTSVICLVHVICVQRC